ncbi:twin-arginine translocation signal domain-containing protein, partial [Brachybacterium tyrofermentans]
MSRHLATPSRRSLLAALGIGAGAAGLAACGSPNASGDNAESNIRDGFSQADHTVPAGYEGRTAILFWAPWTGELFETLMTLFTE